MRSLLSCSSGTWGRDLLAEGLAAAAAAEFRVQSTVRPWSGSFSGVELAARRLAAGLKARGVGPGDVVAVQLPNWMEAAAAFWAAALLGAVVVPIVHFYGRKELSHIVADCRPAVFVTAQRFGRMVFDPDVCQSVPIVGVVGRDFDDHNFDELLADEPLTGVVATDPAGPARIAYTSGHHQRPEGRRAQPPQPGARDPPAGRLDACGSRHPADRRSGHARPTLDEVRTHFEASGVARQKWPEYLHEVDEFPRTPSGKVQKFKVRELARSIATITA